MPHSMLFIALQVVGVLIMCEWPVKVENEDKDEAQRLPTLLLAPWAPKSAQQMGNFVDQLHEEHVASLDTGAVRSATAEVACVKVATVSWWPVATRTVTGQDSSRSLKGP
ncbi:hypothetical protein ACLKA7_013631 [Drosophila subpalustris]